MLPSPSLGAEIGGIVSFNHLIQTKLQIPFPRPYTLPRKRLLRAIEDILQTANVLWLEAPAGFGKSTLLGQWASSVEGSLVYFSFDSSDTLESFCQYLSAGLRRVGCHTENLDSPEFLLSVCSGESAPSYLVLDDYHIHSDPELHEFVESLCRQLSFRSRLVIASREEPPFPAERLFGNGRMARFDTEQLRFEMEELRELLETFQYRSPSQEIQDLLEQAEGWPAAVLTLLQNPPVKRFSSPERSREALLGYLLQDALSSFSDSARTGLLSLAIVDRFNRELAGVLCPGDSFEELELQSWFFVQLDSEWYRFHHLFSRFLGQESERVWPEEKRADLHRLAGHWFELQGMTESAIPHFLRAGDWGRACSLIKNAISLSKLFNGYRKSQRWFEMLPKGEMDQALYSRLGVAFWGSYAPKKAYHAFLEGVQSVDAAHKFLCAAGLSLCASSLGSFEKGLEWLEAALVSRPEEDSPEKLIGLYFVAGTYLQLGQAGKAQECLDYCESQLLLPLDERPIFFGMISALTREFSGRYEDAARLHTEVLERSEALQHAKQLKISYGFLARCHYNLGDLAAAGQCWERYFQLPGPSIELMMERRFFPAYLQYLEARGEWEKLRECVEHYRSGIRGGGDETVVDLLKLRYDEGSSASDKLSFYKDYWPLSQQKDAQLEYSCYQRYLTCMNLALEAPNEQAIEKSLGWAHHLADRAVEDGRYRDLVELELVLSRCYLSRGEHDRAEEYAKSALRRGICLKLAAVFWEQRGAFFRFLTSLDKRVLELAGGWSKLETLSERELEILELVALGLSNKQISEQLFVSLHTIKWYNQKIFRKLGVHSRLEIQGKAKFQNLREKLSGECGA